MKPLGLLPADVPADLLLNTIGENILVADPAFNVVWMNEKAAKLMTLVAPLFDLSGPSDVIGRNMDFFHKRPEYQRKLMNQLDESHRRRITIKDKYVADIVVNPIHTSDREIAGYVILLQDVTTQAAEETRREALLTQLSVPIIPIWDQILLVPLIGAIDEKRFQQIIDKLLEATHGKSDCFVILDLSQVTEMTAGLEGQLAYIGNCLKVLGAHVMAAGISPDLSYSMVRAGHELPFETYFSVRAVLKHLMKQENIK